MNYNVKPIKKNPLKDKITTVRLTSQVREMVDASARINKVNKSVVIQDALSTYFNIS